MTWTLVPNIIAIKGQDKLGVILTEIKDRLVATGLWRVKGSGDGFRGGGNGPGANFAFDGITAPAASYDVFTAPLAQNYVFNTSYNPKSLTNAWAWFLLEEIGSGRCMLFQRDSPSYRFGIEIALGGYDGAGAHAGNGPLPLGERRMMFGQRYAGSQTGYAPARYLAGSDSYLISQGLDQASTTRIALHFWCETQARAGGVCPFCALIVDTSTPARGGGIVYESLVDAPINQGFPAVVGAGVPNMWSYPYTANVQGTNLNQTVGNDAYWFGGSELRGVNASCEAAMNTSTSPLTARPADGDGFWRTFRPYFVVPPYGAGSIYQRLGTSEHFIANAVARDYPTTYGVATDSPYVSSGLFLLPWKRDLAPAWGP